jgi:phage terminase large subunit
MTEGMDKDSYIAAPVISEFMLSGARIRLIIGPFGSGKSTGCVMEILRRAMAQEPGPDGIRRTRWAAVRNTYPELRDTTKKTFEEWVPKEIRTWYDTENTYIIQFNDVYCEVLFRALDRPEDVKKLLSLDLTGAWVNEAREIERAIVDGLDARVGRYPAIKNGGPTWLGVFMDTNPPDTDHWIYTLFEEDTLLDPRIDAKYKVFHQPSGLSPEAENIRWLPPGYYDNLAIGKDPEWVKVYVHGQYGFVMDGKAVWPEFHDEIHTLNEPPRWLGGTIYLGMDFGLTPAIVALQKLATGQWQALEEFIAYDMGATKFSQFVVTELKRIFPGAEYLGWGDPAGSQRAQTDEDTPFNVVQAAGLPIGPAHTNDFILRREAVANALSRLTITGKPALVISPNCRVLRKAMMGGYCFKRVQAAGPKRFKDIPDKNHFSHISDALQYAMLGAGEDSSALASRDRSNDSRNFKVIPSLRSRR